MTDQGDQQRPVRTLTVKNFSVIKEAKLDFGKITVLIGPQSSGKSLLCKLAYFLNGEIPGIAVESLLDGSSWNEFVSRVIREFNSRFLTQGQLQIDTEVAFESYEYAVKLHCLNGFTAEIQLSSSEEFENLYNLIKRNRAEQLAGPNALRSELRSDLFVQFSLLLGKKRTQSTTYIPAGRALFTDPSKSILTLQNPELDQITKRFAGLILWGTRWKAGYLTTGRGVIQEVEKGMDQIARGTVIVSDGRPSFLSFNGLSLPLSVQSSGTLELLPMLNVVDQLACFQEDIYARMAGAKISPIADISDHSPFVYLEEPEANVFPKTQYELVQLFAWLANDPVLDFDWVITTHSPYILTAFNTLIEAWRVGNKEGKREQVAALIPEKYWVNENEFKAYTIEDSVLKSIFEKETEGKEGSGLIDGGYLDAVSDQIGGEFDKLLDIEYAG